jgi:predicted metalloprotease with PDZ domain
VAESSFDAWIKYYRQDENAPNSLVNYYQKGALVALALDLTIRTQTAGRRSLDDVMRQLWREFKRAGAAYAGVGEDGILKAAEAATGLKLARALREWTEGTRDPDFAALLAPFGIEFLPQPALDAPAFALLGATTARNGETLLLANVFDHSPARAAGLSGGDVLVAIDGLRITAESFDKQLARYAPGDTVELVAFRRDELMRFEVTLATRPPLRYALRVAAKAGAARRAADRLRRGWLGSH